ncbi:MAG: hypothetical protein IJB93_06895 [Clostridia bacterium]|nr:hypothetical protein [Clostridia bacterium]MBQ4349453.1 hypothetical protein [Clostridia bacterium]
MKKTIAILLSVIFVMSFCACAKLENRADTSLKDGEIMLSGYVAESYGSSLLLQKADGYDWEDYVGDRVFVNIGINTDFVVDGWYVTDLSPDSFEGEYISVICSESVLETYPVQLQGERMIILLD